MSDNTGDVKNGSMTLKKGADLIEFLLEGAEMEYFSTDIENGKTIELPNGIFFIFDNNGELTDINLG